MEARFGFRARVMVASGSDVATVVAENPMCDAATDPARLMVAFVADSGDLDAVRPMAARGWEPEALAVGSRAAYLWCPNGIIDSMLAKEFGRALGDRVTLRNWATVLKIHAACAQSGSGR